MVILEHVITNSESSCLPSISKGKEFEVKGYDAYFRFNDFIHLFWDSTRIGLHKCSNMVQCCTTSIVPVSEINKLMCHLVHAVDLNVPEGSSSSGHSFVFLPFGW